MEPEPHIANGRSGGQSSLSHFVSRRSPLDVAKAPFDDHAGSGLTVDDDLGATARAIWRREKYAFLDACLPGRRFEKPSSPVRQNTKHGTALANPLKAHVRMDVKA